MEHSQRPRIERTWNVADATILLVCLAFHLVSGLIALVAISIATDSLVQEWSNPTTQMPVWVDAASILLIITWIGMEIAMFALSMRNKPAIIAVIPVLFLLLSLATTYGIAWFS